MTRLGGHRCVSGIDAMQADVRHFGSVRGAGAWDAELRVPWDIRRQACRDGGESEIAISSRLRVFFRKLRGFPMCWPRLVAVTGQKHLPACVWGWADLRRSRTPRSLWAHSVE